MTPEWDQDIAQLYYNMGWASLGMESCSVFEMWLEKEKVYLNALRKEPEQETLQMEYYQKLVNLQDQEARLTKIQATGGTQADQKIAQSGMLSS
ncbi:hypothetical protein B0H14DRAFT_3730239 [Mycena olivaceomarginata]|nr:hypothetical protein B0H14DRAFT_3730239 [Mycena olivaceomarginata]